jgi:hypothetical protein
MKYCILLISLLLLPGTGYAAYGERWYNVEVIIFAYSSDTGIQEEYWPLETGIPDISNSVSLVRHDNATERLPGEIIDYETLPFNMLSAALNRLRRSGRYNVIYSQAWRLPDLPSRSANPVRIRAGKRYDANGDIAAIVPTGLPGQPQFMVDDALYEIDGRIKISLSKFLDVDADLLYRRHVNLPDDLGMPVNEFRQFRLTEFRRMKSKTIHYLDHPLFGVLIGIDRYRPPGSEDSPKEEIRPKSISEINQ